MENFKVQRFEEFRINESKKRENEENEKSLVEGNKEDKDYSKCDWSSMEDKELKKKVDALKKDIKKADDDKKAELEKALDKANKELDKRK